MRRMRKQKERRIPHIEVADADEAFRKLEAFSRRMMSVPKTKIDAILAKEKSARRKKPS
jgi:hypothetical protein